MKTTFGTILSAPLGSMAAIFLALCAFTPLSRADVIIDNTGNPLTSYVLKNNNPLAQVFTMSGTSGNLSTLTVSLHVYVQGSATINLYDATSGGAPFGLAVATLGTVSTATTGDQSFNLSLQNSPLLSASATYAIVLETPTSGQFGFQATSTSSSGGSGTLGGIYYNNGTWTSTGNYWKMDLETTPVPEVPVTGLVMGFGALAIAIGHTLRHKLRPAVPPIA